MNEPSPPVLTVIGLPGMPEVEPGADLAALLGEAFDRAGLVLQDGDVVVVASKVVAKAAGLMRRAPSRAEAIAEETVRTVAARRTPAGGTEIVQSRSGPVMAAAGVDASNTPVGTVLVLPPDPDASAREIRAGLRRGAAVPRRLGVVVTDTTGRPWRDGVGDIAIGAAGMSVLEDLRGRLDGHGNPLEVTVRAVADELAAAADLVKGKLAGVPAAVVRGAGAYVLDDDGPGAATALRPAGQDWFRYGHVEAVRAALTAGLPGAPASVEPPAVWPEDVAARAQRAVALACGGIPGQVSGRFAQTPAPGSAAPDVTVELDAGSAYVLGLAVARLHVALWSEHLVGRPLREEAGLARFAVRELPD